MVSQQSVSPQEALKRLHVMINVVVRQRIHGRGKSTIGTKIEFVAHRDWSARI